MGTSYTTAALHTIRYEDPASLVPLEPEVDTNAAWTKKMLENFSGKPATMYDGNLVRYISTPIVEILAWRDRLSNKYLSQLGQPLTWDEATEFNDSEDTFSSGDAMLSYVAAVLDQRGEEDAARTLLDVQRPLQADRDTVFEEARRRQFSSRFPQILLRPHFYLPFERHLVIEEPDWRGTVLRFGSLFRVAEELAEVRRFIVQADPRVMTVAPDAPLYDRDVLTSAWVVSECIWRLANTAMMRRLPFWGDNR